MNSNLENQPISIMSAGELDSLLNSIAIRELAKWKDVNLLVRACGSLRRLDEQRLASQTKGWKKMYAFQLENEGAITLDSSLSLMEGFQNGDFVEVVGFPVANVHKGIVSFKLELVSSRHFEGPAVIEKRRKVVQDLNYLRRLRSTRHPFPIQLDRVSLSVIFPSSTNAAVDRDFTLALGDQSKRFLITPVPVRIGSAEAVANAISESNSQILAIIRGGGNEADFNAFNDPLVLDALAGFPGYRVLGVGHTANVAMADLICDFSASVPAAAGVHLRDQLAIISNVFEALESRHQRLEHQVAKLETELRQRRDSERNAKEHVTLSRLRATLQRNWPWLVALVLLILWKT